MNGGMGNHYHLVVEASEGKLAKGMRQLMVVKTRKQKAASRQRRQTPEPKPGQGIGQLLGAGEQMLMWRKLGLGLLLLFLTVGAYGTALQAGYIWDDNDYLTENFLVRSGLDGLKHIWFTTQTPQYYPLVFTSFWLEYALWGLNPFGYHLVNVLLHAANALLVWRIFHTLGVPGAWWIGAIFALHPVHVESVAWITERKNVLSGLFYLLALRQYLAFEERQQIRICATAFLLYVCALLSKSVTATLPAAILIVLWFKERQITLGKLLGLLPFLIVGAASGLFTAWLEIYKVGASGVDWDLNLLQRFVLVTRILWFYTLKLIWPAELIFTYPRWTLDLGDPVQYAGLIGVGLVALALRVFRNRLGRGPAAGCLFFVVTLAPVLGFLDVYPMRFSFVADHFQYLASLGILALVVASAAWIWERWVRPKENWRGVGIAVGTLLLAVLAILTWRQSQIYQDGETLYRDTLRKNPGSWMAHNNLGRILLNRGDTETATQHFRAALALQSNSSDVLNNLGSALYYLGRTSEAMDFFHRSLTIDPNNFRARNNLGGLLLDQGHIEEAMSELREALRLQPLYPAANNTIGIALAKRGKVGEAIHHFRQAVQINPAYAKAQYNLGIGLAKQGELEEAIEHLRQAVLIQPDFAEAHESLGRALAEKGRKEEALKHYEAALRIMQSRSSGGVAR